MKLYFCLIDFLADLYFKFSQGMDNCSDFADCVNLPGLFECQCFEGKLSTQLFML